MNISGLSIKRPMTTIMLVFIVIIVGFMGLTRLKQDLMPDISIAVAVVSSTYTGAAPEEVENLVTRPLESALGRVSNVKDITSTSSDGSSIVILEFVDGTDMDNASLKMREAIDMIKRYLPSGVEPRVFQIDPNMLSSFQIAVTGMDDPVELYNRISDDVVKNIERTEGVASVDITGGKQKMVSVELMPDRMAYYGVTSAQISQAVSSENLNLPVGEVRQGDTKLQLRTVGQFMSLDDIRNLPLTSPTGASLRLNDVADVFSSYKEVTSYSIVNGKASVVLNISKQSTANTVDVANGVKAELDILRKTQPDLTFTVIVDNSTYITQSISSVASNAVMGAFLAMLVLMLFLGNVRPSVIVGIAMPVSIVATLGLMFFANMTLNMVSLMGLTISVGMLVDNSIVVLENIYRYNEMGYDMKDAAREGAKEVSLAVIASTLTTVAVFVPVVFTTGMVAEMFKQLALTICFSIAASLVVALTVVPMMCSKFLKVGKKKEKKNLYDRFNDAWNRAFDRVLALYATVLRYSVGHRAMVCLIALTILAGTSLAIAFVGMEFIPTMDEGIISISVTTPKGALLDETSTLTQEVASRLDGQPDIRDMIVTIGGGGSALGGGNSNSARILLNLTPQDERPGITQLIERYRNTIGEVAGCEIGFGTANNAITSFAGSSNTTTFYLYGDEMDELNSAFNDLKTVIQGIEGTRTVSSSLEEGYPQARIVIDRDKAASLGVSAAYIANTLSTAVTGQTITRYKVEGREEDVILSYPSDSLTFLPDIEGMSVTIANGSTIPLLELAQVEVSVQPASITRSNQRRYITITCEYFGRDLNSYTRDLTEVLNAHPIPEGIHFEIGGTYETMMSSMSDLLVAFALGFLLLYMVIVSQFESLMYPFIIIFSVPIAMSAGLLGLLITGQTISVLSMLGLILLMGIVVNNAIVLVDYINTLRKEGRTTIDAVLAAGPIRLRPILMTTLTTVLGLLPMLFTSGIGTEVQRPMAATIVFGLSFATLVTLVLIPVLYLMLHEARKRLRQRFMKSSPSEVAPV